MQRLGAQYTVQDAQGRGIPNATITVYLAGTTTLATVYPATGSATPTVPQANPFTTDSYGRWQVALPDGRYDISVSSTGAPAYTITNVCEFDNTITYPSPMLGTVTSIALGGPAEFNFSAAVTSAGTLTFSYGTWAASKLLIAPTGGGTPTLRNLVLADLPNFGGAAATYGTGALIPVITVNAQGIPTGFASTTNTPAWSSLTGKPTTASYAVTGIVDGYCELYSNASNGSLFNSTTETSLFGMIGISVGSRTIAANSLRAGSVIRVRGTIITGNVGVNMTFKLKIGATAALTLAAQCSGAQYCYSFDYLLHVTTIGVSGTIYTVPLHLSGNSAGVSLATALVALTSVDTTAAWNLDLTAQLAAASANQGFQIVNLDIIQEG